jgi:hypothetical protein
LALICFVVVIAAIVTAKAKAIEKAIKTTRGVINRPPVQGAPHRQTIQKSSPLPQPFRLGFEQLASCGIKVSRYALSWRRQGRRTSPVKGYQPTVTHPSTHGHDPPPDLEPKHCRANYEEIGDRLRQGMAPDASPMPSRLRQLLNRLAEVGRRSTFNRP